MLKSTFEFEILVNGHPTKEFYHKGSSYIEGKEGSKFSLRMRNNSSNKALFVPTVDGLSIMDGKEASFNSRGYIVPAYDAVTIDGWRTSDDKVAEFFFSSPKGSYAKKMNKGNNLGVIGCAVFKEKERVQTIKIVNVPYFPAVINPWWSWTSITTTTYDSDVGSGHNVGGGAGVSGDYSTKSVSLRTSGDTPISCYSCSSASGSGTTQMSASNTGTNFVGAALGTGFGQEKTSQITKVSFDAEDSPTEVFSIFYNTKANLEALGIEFTKPVYVAPSAFPNEDGYCQKPY